MQTQSRRAKQARPLTRWLRAAERLLSVFGRRTLYNRTGRDALQLKCADGTFAVPNFDPLRSGVPDTIRSQLA